MGELKAAFAIFKDAEVAYFKARNALHAAATQAYGLRIGTIIQKPDGRRFMFNGVSAVYSATEKPIVKALVIDIEGNVNLGNEELVTTWEVIRP